MERTTDIWLLIRECNILLDRFFNELSLTFDVRGGTQGRVIRYLYRHRDEDTFQKILEKRFSVRSSTMTSIIAALENDGFICREKSNVDSRLKKITLTEKGIEEGLKMDKQTHTLEKKVSENLSKEDVNNLSGYLITIISNLKEARKE